MTKFIIVALFNIKGETISSVVTRLVDNKKYSSHVIAERHIPRESPREDDGFIGYKIEEIRMSVKQEVLLQFPEAKLVTSNGTIKKYRIYNKKTESYLTGFYHTELEAWEHV